MAYAPGQEIINEKNKSHRKDPINHYAPGQELVEKEKRRKQEHLEDKYNAKSSSSVASSYNKKHKYDTANTKDRGRSVNSGKGTLTNILSQELANLDGIQSQNPETGAGINSGTVYIDQYTNRIFGAPYQLIDSVDKRFDEVNKYVGNEYLRNFILNSPILHVKPGIPIYTGRGQNGLVNMIKQIYIGTNTGMSFAEALLNELGKATIFKSGGKLQRRLFGFRENYYGYMSRVNYMCRSMAVFLNLTSTNTDLNKYPTGIFANGSDTLQPFATMNWENYRMLSTSKVTNPSEQMARLTNATFIGAAGRSAFSALSNSINGIKDLTGDFANAVASRVSSLMGDYSEDTFKKDIVNTLGRTVSNTVNDTKNAFVEAATTSVVDVLVDKISSVLFMVEPSQFEETYSNTVESSLIESVLDGVNNGVGQELAFITGSNADFGLVEGMAEFLGNTVVDAANFLSGLVEQASGGYAANLFRGAIGSIKGQKMIYPKIYKSSNSEMNYNFSVTLSVPYGDVYNYYTGIVVPLMHIIGLVAPNMITANAIGAPYLVQAFIPGMCTCNMGIISSMTVIKNPSGKRVSVNGYPLEVKVNFTIQELYNSMALSAANDPASFLFNETLNDYMANMAGLQPSTDTYTRQRKASFQNLEHYFKSFEFLNDLSNSELLKWEERINPFINKG